MVNITVHSEPNIKRTFRATRRLRRRLNNTFRAFGALVLLFALLIAAGGGHADSVLLFALPGVLLIVEVDLVLWLHIRRNRKALLDPADITITEDRISRRTATTSFEVGWDRVQRVIDQKDFWIFVVNRLQVVTLYKSHLTPEQTAELAAFLAARPSPANKRTNPGATPVTR